MDELFKEQWPNNFFNFFRFVDSKIYLQIKGTARGTIFAPTYAYLIMEYPKIKVYYIIRQTHALASKHFQNS